MAVNNVTCIRERETARLAALHRYRILDTEPERRFDDLAMLASHICGTPMALITLVDEHRQWFKSRVGISVAETSRAVSFCAHAIEQQDLFIVPDTLHDERFRDNPQVTGDPHVRFYAGAALVTRDGHALGALCVIDRRPRALTANQREALAALRRQVESQLELRRDLIELEQALAARDRAEAEEAATMDELRAAHQNVRRLGGLIPFCSTCQFTMTIPADPAVIPTVTGWRRPGSRGEALAGGGCQGRRARAAGRIGQRHPPRLPRRRQQAASVLSNLRRIR